MIILTHEILSEVEDNNAFIVLVKSIAKRASFDSLQACFPSLKTISADTGLSKPTVLKSLSYLEKIGVLHVTRKKNKRGENVANTYRVTTEKIKIAAALKTESKSPEPVEGGGKTDLPPSKGDLPPVVKEIDTNHRSNRTTSTDNRGGGEKKLKNQNSENEIQIEPPKKFREPAKSHTTPTPPILEKLLEALPEVKGLPHVKGIVEAVEDKPEDERMSYLEWVVMNKRQNPKLIEPKAWKDWFWLDYKGKDFQPAQAPPPPEIDGYVSSPDGRRYRTTAIRPEDL